MRNDGEDFAYTDWAIHFLFLGNLHGEFLREVGAQEST